MSGDFWVFRNAEQVERFAEHCRLLMTNGRRYMAQVVEYRPPKTTPQINYVHKLIRCIAGHHHWDIDDTKDDCKLKWGEWTRRPNLLGGPDRIRYKSFADYSRQEMSHFIRELEVYCDENRIERPDREAA